MEDRPERANIGPGSGQIVGSIISSIFLSIGLLIILVALAEILVFLIDSLGMGNDQYMDWWRSPLITFAVAVPFLVIHIVMRFNLIHRINQGIRSKAPPKRIETIDLD